MANRKNGTLYIGVTSNLMQRIAQHREGTFEGFAKDNDCKRLMWLGQYGDMNSAITREKQMKKWKRQWKINLLEKENPAWFDLAVDLGFDPLPSQG
ncbi:Excinuclease ABC, C subunit-like [hydrothermal vent metagenome]|uniref:Excinuclease ABC, C subunit-like n=1 Tax=hydrothermal vent metagenome TaxID=652676 RepID=A0A3B0R962_9ZZZZ